MQAVANRDRVIALLTLVNSGASAEQLPEGQGDVVTSALPGSGREGARIVEEVLGGDGFGYIMLLLSVRVRSLKSQALEASGK